MPIHNRSLSDDYFSSPSLREFLRVANETPALQDVLASKPIEKQASISASEEPKSFTEALLKLCSDLRTNGFGSYAFTLEQKFLLLKKAEAMAASEGLTKKAERHLYNVHDESGDDLIEFSHPGGGNKDLDKRWGDLGEVETISERQKKMLAVLSKVPTQKSVSPQAKKADSKLPSIATIAKLILAAPDQVSQLRTNIKETVIAIRKQLKYIDDLVHARGKVALPVRADYNAHLAQAIGLQEFDTMTLEALSKLKDVIDGMKSDINSRWNSIDVRRLVADSDGRETGLFGRIYELIATAQKDIAALQDLEASSMAPGASAPGEHSNSGAAHPHSATSNDISVVFQAASEAANNYLVALKGYEAKVADDPRKADVLRKTEASVVAYINDLGALMSALKQPGAEFAAAANQAGSHTFEGIKSVSELKNDINGYFAAVGKLVNQAKNW